MGGKSKKVTVGYKYYVGMHWVYCHGPIDNFSQIRVDDRIAWQGTATGGTINISAESLFGGESREGGVSGAVDVAMGALSQTKNAYLLSKIGPNIPAYRGVAAMIFKDFYWGNNPYLKPIKARGQRIHVRQEGIAQWRDTKAAIPASPFASFDLASYFPVLQQGVDPNYPVPPSLYPNSITIGPYTSDCQVIAGNADGSGSCRPDDFFVFNGVQQGSSAAPTYPGGTVLYTLPAGQTLLIQVRNTINELSGVTGALTVKFAGRLDMNPVHMLRECLTDPDWGMGYTDADIDAPSFEAAADTLFAEGLGMSMLWDKQAKIEEFINEIVRHIDAALFVSRKTGKFVLKLIRDDYDPGDLLVLDESNISKISSPSRPAFGELINSVSVTYWNGDTGRDDSVTVQDPAGVQMQGGVINTTLSYPGFTHSGTATRAAARDLRALSNPFLSCTVYTGEIGRDLDIGDTFILNWAKWRISGVIMRVTGYAQSDGKSTEVRLTCVEDVFATPSIAIIAPPGDGWSNPSQPPSPTENDIAFEAPYYELTQINGQSNTDSDLTTNPLQGYVMAASARPENAINAKLWTDAGGGYAESDTMDFAPSGTLAADLDKTTGSATLENASDLDLVELGSFFQIGDELLRIDSVDVATGDITFGRGVLDTVPQAHAAGDRAYFWDLFSGVDPTEYASGETVDVRVTPISGAGQVALADALEHSVTLDQRAYRPYPPGNLTINGDSYVDTFYEGELTVAWAHRDRKQQTSGELADHFDGDIGPEAGTTYRVRVYIDDVLADEEDDIAGTTTAITPPGDGLVRIEVHSKRDDLYSMQAANHEFPYTGSGSLRLIEESEDYRVDEDGNIRITED